MSQELENLKLSQTLPVSPIPALSDGAGLKTAPSLVYGDQLSGQIIGSRYKLERLLGSGGMSIVYQGQDLQLDRLIAFKILHRQLVLQGRSLQRFQQEGKALSKLDHRNIVKIFEYGVHDGTTPYMIMEYVHGKTLSAILETEYKLPIHHAIDVGAQICSALEHAHMLRVIHRDLKPSNIMLKSEDLDEDLIKIVDFGIAKIASESRMQLTNTGEVFGSPLYMSPEQCGGLQTDQRTDLYSLGCILYEMLTGTLPFIGESALATMMLHQQKEPASLREATLGEIFPQELERIVSKLLAKNPDHRYRYAAEVKSDLQNLNHIGYASSDDLTARELPRSDDFIRNIRLQSAERHGLTEDAAEARRQAVREENFAFFQELKAQITVFAKAFGLVGVSCLLIFSAAVMIANQLNDKNSDAENETSTNQAEVSEASLVNEDIGIAETDAHPKEIIDEAEAKAWNQLHSFHPVSLQPSDLHVIHHWEGLARLDRLQSLDLSDVKNPPSFQQLSRLHLRSLNLSGYISPGPMSQLAKIPRLLALNLSATAVTGADMSQLPPSIRDLNLSRCPLINDQGVEVLRRLKHLRNLDLSYTAIKGSCLKTLAKMQLESLNLDGTKIPPAAVADFMIRNPTCVVTNKSGESGSE